MNTIIISGEQASGKTTLAKFIALDKNCCWINPNNLTSPFCFSEVHPLTELIVIDGYKFTPEMESLIDAKRIVINRKGFSPYELKRPNLVIILNEIPEKYRKSASPEFIFKLKSVFTND